MNSIDVNINQLDWEDAAGYPAGAKQKVLSLGSEMVPRAILLKIPAGWSMESHSHVHTELHYVLEGEYESQNKTYSSGTFRVIPKEVAHGPFSSKEGATIIVIWLQKNS